MSSVSNKAAEQEAIFGVAPLLHEERTYSFWDFFFVVSGFGIAVWCYSQGVYIASLNHFSTMICSILGGNMLFMCLMCLVMVPIVRYGIDSWVYFRAVFGYTGVKIVCIAVVIVNFPWYAIGADIFASALISLGSSFGIDLTAVAWRPILGVLCIVLGTVVAIAGPTVLKWANRVLVPTLLAVAVVIVFAAFSSLSGSDLTNFEPDLTAFESARQAYGFSLEGNIAFSMSWISCIGAMPRLCKRESHAYFGAALSYGTMVPIMCLIGGILSVAMFCRFGVLSDDPVEMYAALVHPALAILGLFFIAFSSIAVQGVGSYSFAIVLKSIFPKVGFKLLAFVLAAYVIALILWGGVAAHLGPFMSIGGIIYAPIIGLLIVDFFIVRKQRFSMRSIYRLDGNESYKYHGGFNLLSFIAFAIGVVVMIRIYNPITGSVNSGLFYFIGASAWSCVAAGLAYYIGSRLPSIQNYLLKDRSELTRAK